MGAARKFEELCISQNSSLHVRKFYLVLNRSHCHMSIVAHLVEIKWTMSCYK